MLKVLVLWLCAQLSTPTTESVLQGPNPTANPLAGNGLGIARSDWRFPPIEQVRAKPNPLPPVPQYEYGAPGNWNSPSMVQASAVMLAPAPTAFTPETAVTSYPIPEALASQEQSVMVPTSTDYAANWNVEAGLAPTQSTYEIAPFDDPNSVARKTEFGHPLLDRLKSAFGRRRGRDLGFGHERVMFAPILVETATSTPNVGLRMRFDHGLARPDRLEYYWGRSQRGPGPEQNLDLIDSYFRMELGSERAVAITELNMRALNPELNPNTVGFGDMAIGGKAVMFDGTCTKISSVFRTYLKTGPIDRGLGNGHVSLEPGVLVRHQWSESCYLHGETKYFIPIAGSAGFAGDVLKTGWGVSTIWRETDYYALMPTLELQTYSFLFGSETRSDGSVVRVNGTTAVDLITGMRLASSRSSLGLWELGGGAAVTLADRDWFDSRIAIDLRWIR